MKFGVFFLSQAPEGMLTPVQALALETGQMRLAEELGFDSVWLAEHHGSSYCVVPDTLTYAAHVASLTSRVRIGLAVSVLPLRNPLEFAERAAFVDVLSGGRLDVGVGRGYSKTEFETFGLRLEDRRDRFEEALDLLLRCWTEDRFDHEGRFWHFRNISLYPKPVQAPHPPVFVASSGSPDTVAGIARRGLPFLQGDDFLTPARVAERFETYRSLAAEAGRTATEAGDSIARSWIAQKVYLAATTREAREFAKPYLLWRHRKVLELLPPPPAPTLVSKVRSRVPALKVLVTSPERKDPHDITADDLAAFDLIGTPDDAIARLEDFRRAGVHNVLLQFTYGGMPDEAVRRSMSLFAKEVAPALARDTVHA